MALWMRPKIERKSRRANMDAASVAKQQPGYLLEKIDQDILLYKPDDVGAVCLNQTAALVWELADGTRNVGEIVEMIEGAFPGVPGLAADVHETLEQLVENGALAVLSEVEP
jgi:hypothetical protein